AAKEGAKFVRRRQNTERVEVGPAQKDGIRAKAGWQRPQRPQLGEGVVIDVVDLRHVLPDEVWSGRNESELHRSVLVQVAHQDGRLAELQPAHFAARSRFGELVREFIDGEPADVADAAVAKRRPHVKLNAIGWLDEHLRSGR